jgi:predicted nucleic acid-binding Zn ribbon protein
MAECEVCGKAQGVGHVLGGSECYRIGYERQRARAEAAEADFQNCAHELEISDAAADRAVARASRLEAALLEMKCDCLRDLFRDGDHRSGCPYGIARAALSGQEGP